MKITRSKKLITGASHAPKSWHPLIPFKLKFTMSGDGWTDLITHHVWFYTRRGARFVRIVRRRSRYETACHQAAIANEQIRRDEKLARKHIDSLRRDT